MISGDLDFRTPPENTEKLLMPFLKNGKNITISNSSHMDIVKNVMSSPLFLKHFFDNGEAETKFLNQVKPIDFNPKTKISKFKIWIMGIIK